jgi:hypothetical protein
MASDSYHGPRGDGRAASATLCVLGMHYLPLAGAGHGWQAGGRAEAVRGRIADDGDTVDRPGDLGGSDPWKDAESCLHSGNTPMSCVSAR